MSKVFWRKLRKIVSQIGPEIRRVSEMVKIENQRLSEMLKLSEEVHKKIMSEILPKATDEQINFIAQNHSDLSPFYYKHWYDCISENGDFDEISDIDKTKMIDNIYSNVAESIIEDPNPFCTALAAEISMLGREGVGDLLSYYANQRIRTHEWAMSVWEEKIASERREFEKSLRAWVGLFAVDDFAEHYYQVLSETLSSYSVRV
jgi:hypothetical protein